LGLYFPCELQLSYEFALANDLIRRKKPDGTVAGGLFEENRRVRIQKIRGVKSYGFWISLDALEKLGGDISILREGDTIDTWASKPVCNKYVPKGTSRTYKQKAPKTKVKKYSYVFPEHADTDQFRYNVRRFQKGDEIVITGKLHGTSQRIARNYEIRPLRWWEKIINKFTPIDTKTMAVLNGTRRVVLNNNNTKGFHSDDMRDIAANKLAAYLDNHMQVFFEVVGWEPNGSPIMPAHSTDKSKDPEVKDSYRNPIHYTYGCPKGELDVYVYRIAWVLPSGRIIDFTWDEVKSWCDTHKVKHVPEVDRFIFDGDYDILVRRVEALTEGPDPLDNRHPKEGVCVRKNSNQWMCFKEKGWVFKVLEGIAKEDDSYEDQEEIQSADIV